MPLVRNQEYSHGVVSSPIRIFMPLLRVDAWSSEPEHASMSLPLPNELPFVSCPAYHCVGCQACSVWQRTQRNALTEEGSSSPHIQFRLPRLQLLN